MVVIFTEVENTQDAGSPFGSGSDERFDFPLDPKYDTGIMKYGDNKYAGGRKFWSMEITNMQVVGIIFRMYCRGEGEG